MARIRIRIERGDGELIHELTTDLADPTPTDPRPSDDARLFGTVIYDAIFAVVDEDADLFTVEDCRVEALANSRPRIYQYDDAQSIALFFRQLAHAWRSWDGEGSVPFSIVQSTSENHKS